MLSLSVRMFAALAVLAAVPASAQNRPPHPAAHAPARQAGGPKRIGKWEDWQAATHQEAGQPVCYAFTRPTASAPAVPGRGDVVLTVTQRPGGRDVVALSAGFAYAPNAEVELVADGVTVPFYTARSSAFARDGKAVVGLLGKARQAVARSPGPRGTAVADTFSLHGFTQAYAAVAKTCPSR
ncbi:MAG TPA: invasion associated locus B family protein [Acetobacteraceae bacterium]|nr:invasion associated locus B family protein [Acetobacteraceae bacterium]